MSETKIDQDIEYYYLLKGRFKGTMTNTFGLFIIFFSFTQKIVDNVVVAASHFSSIYDTPVETEWAAFEDKITQLKWKGEISTNTSHDLQLLLTNTIKTDVAEELIDAMQQNNINKIDHTITNILIKGLIDKSVDVQVKFQKISHRDIINTKDERARKEKEEKEIQQRDAVRKAEEERFKVEDGAVTLPVNLVLAPVSGIPVYDVKTNDQIMVKIEASSEKGNYFIDLLNARSPEGSIMPVKGMVKEIAMNALGEFELLVEIGPGIYGKTIESEQVKVKKYDIREEKIRVDGRPQPGTQMQQGQNPLPGTQQVIKAKNAVKGNKDYFIWLVGGITFLLAILIIYLLFSGLL